MPLVIMFCFIKSQEPFFWTSILPKNDQKNYALASRMGQIQKFKAHY